MKAESMYIINGKLLKKNSFNLFFHNFFLKNYE